MASRGELQNERGLYDQEGLQHGGRQVGDELYRGASIAGKPVEQPGIGIVIGILDLYAVFL